MAGFDELYKEFTELPLGTASSFKCELFRASVPKVPLMTKEAQIGVLRLEMVKRAQGMEAAEQLASEQALVDPTIQQALDYQQALAERNEFERQLNITNAQLQEVQQQAMMAQQQAAQLQQAQQDTQMQAAQAQEQANAEAAAKQEAISQAVQAKDENLQSQMAAADKREQLVVAADDLKNQLEQFKLMAAENPVSQLQEQQMQQQAAMGQPDPTQPAQVQKQQQEAVQAQQQAALQEDQAVQAQNQEAVKQDLGQQMMQPGQGMVTQSALGMGKMGSNVGRVASFDTPKIQKDGDRIRTALKKLVKEKQQFGNTPVDEYLAQGKQREKVAVVLPTVGSVPLAALKGAGLGLVGGGVGGAGLGAGVGAVTAPKGQVGERALEGARRGAIIGAALGAPGGALMGAGKGLYTKRRAREFEDIFVPKEEFMGAAIKGKPRVTAEGVEKYMKTQKYTPEEKLLHELGTIPVAGAVPFSALSGIGRGKKPPKKEKKKEAQIGRALQYGAGALGGAGLGAGVGGIGEGSTTGMLAGAGLGALTGATGVGGVRALLARRAAAKAAPAAISTAKQVKLPSTVSRVPVQTPKKVVTETTKQAPTPPARVVQQPEKVLTDVQKQEIKKQLPKEVVRTTPGRQKPISEKVKKEVGEAFERVTLKGSPAGKGYGGAQRATEADVLALQQQKRQQAQAAADWAKYEAAMGGAGMYHQQGWRGLGDSFRGLFLLLFLVGQRHRQKFKKRL
jgi:hypothetical protein